MNISDKLIPMKYGNELLESLAYLPEYDSLITQLPVPARLIELSNLYSVYIPSSMTVEIYNKIYLALYKSLKNKSSKIAIQQQNENYKTVMGQSGNGLMGGIDSFTIIGSSGIGKSSAIARAIDVATENKLIETKQPFSKIIPCLNVQCPFDSSVKGLLLEILRKTDYLLSTQYYDYAIRARATTDMLIGSVSQVALNHVGVLVVDEIQNVVNSKNGKLLVGMLTQLINNSGISICMVGTPECISFFEQAPQLARRTLGLQYYAMDYNDEFYDFCEYLLRYQYTKYFSTDIDGIINWLYEHSNGVLSVVISLVHDAQEIAITSGYETFDISCLAKAYTKRLSMLHGYVSPQQKNQYKKQQSKNTIQSPQTEQAKSEMSGWTVSDLVVEARKDISALVCLLKKYIPVIEVDI